MTYRLLILACSERKKGGPEYMPAIERYDGPLWQTLRSIELPPNMAVMFVSAKYGLRRASHAIEKYDDRLTPEVITAMRNGDVYWKPEHVHDAERDHGVPVKELRDAAERIRLHYETRYAEFFEDVCLVGGHTYLDVMRLDLVGAQYREGCQTVDPRARVTEINGAIGIMRQQLRAWICDGGRAILEPMA